MLKLLTIVFTTAALSACGSGSSGDAATSTGGAGTTTGATTGATTGESDSAGTTTGTSEDNGTTAGTASDGAGTTTGASDGTGSTTGTGVIGGGSTAGVNQFGTVNVDNDGLVSFDASFFTIAQATAFPTVLSAIRPDTDRCDVTSFSIGGEIPELPETIGGSTITGISAGEVLTVSSPAGSYTELFKNEMFGFIFYQSDDDVPLIAPAPTNLNISIPGDVFPAFNNIPLPVAEPLQVSSPAIGVPITASTTFSWTPSNNPDSFIEIFASSITANFANSTSVSCTLIDDGSFQFPASVTSALGSGFSGIGSLSRFGFSSVQQGNAVLFLTSSSDRAN